METSGLYHCVGSWVHRGIAGLVGIVQYADDTQMSFLKGGTLLAGVVMILGALAYRSTKRAMPRKSIGEQRSATEPTAWSPNAVPIDPEP